MLLRIRPRHSLLLLWFLLRDCRSCRLHCAAVIFSFPCPCRTDDGDGRGCRRLWNPTSKARSCASSPVSGPCSPSADSSGAEVPDGYFGIHVGRESNIVSLASQYLSKDLLIVHSDGLVSVGCSFVGGRLVASIDPIILGGGGIDQPWSPVPTSHSPLRSLPWADCMS